MLRWFRFGGRSPAPRTSVDLWVDSGGVCEGNPLAPGRPGHRGHREAFERIRGSCVDLLKDIDTNDAHGIAWRVACTRNLTELWYLRPSIYAAVARVICEAEARLRMRKIDAIVPNPHTSLR